MLKCKIELTTILVALLAIATATTLVVISDEADAIDNKANDTGYFIVDGLAYLQGQIHKDDVGLLYVEDGVTRITLNDTVVYNGYTYTVYSLVHIDNCTDLEYLEISPGVERVNVDAFPDITFYDADKTTVLEKTEPNLIGKTYYKFGEGKMARLLEIGDTFTVDGIIYEILNLKMGEAVVAGAESGTGTLNIPSSVTIGDYTFNVVTDDLYDTDGTTALEFNVANLAGQEYKTGEDGKLVRQPNVGETFVVDGVIYEVTDRDMKRAVASGATAGTTDVKVLRIVDYANAEYFVTDVKSKAFYGSTEIKTAEIETDMQDRTFCGCTSLESVVLGKRCTVIGDYDFYNCTSLREAYMIGNYVELGVKAFCGCTGLECMDFIGKITIGTKALYGIKFYDGDVRLTADSDSLSYERFTGKDSTLYLDRERFTYNDVIYKPTSSREAEAIFYKSGVTSAVIYETVYDSYQNPYTVTGVADKAFYSCKTLESLECRITGSIGYKAFANCTSLNTVMARNVSSVGEYAFFKCPIEYLNLGNDSTPMDIKKSAFSGCKSLDFVIFGNIASVGTNAFYGTKFVEPDGTTPLSPTADNLSIRTFNRENGVLVCGIYDGYTFTVGDLIYTIKMIFTTDAYVTGHLDGVTDIVVNDTVKCGNSDVNVKEVSYKAFYGCTTLKTAEIAVSVNNRAFTNCTSLEKVTLDGATNHTYVGPYAFYNCASLSEVDIGDNYALDVKSFAGCKKLTSVSFDEDLSLESNTFYNAKFYDGETLLDKNVKNLEGKRFVGSDSVLYLDRDAFEDGGVIYKPVNATQAEAIGYVDGITSANISDYAYTSTQTPYDVIGISDSAFYGCTTLQNLYYSVAGPIGSKAFANCGSLTTVILSEPTYIGSYAFFNCPIENMTVGWEVTPIEIANSAFSRCPSLREVSLGNISSLGAAAFRGTTFYEPDATTVIPHSAENLKNHEFTYIDGKLVSELYEGYETAVDGVIYRISIETDWTADAVGYVEGVTDIVIGDTVEICGASFVVSAIADRAFYGCNTLRTAEITCDDIGNRAFTKCTSLEKLVLNTGLNLTHVEGYAFYGCTALSEIYIGDDYKIDTKAFAYCPSLTKVEFGTGLELGSATFYGTKFYDGDTKLDQTDINLSERTFIGTESILYLYLDPFYLDNVEYTPQSSHTAVVSGYVSPDVNPDGTLFIDSSVYDDHQTRYNVVGIANRAFYGNTDITYVSYDGSGQIGDRAFAHCSALKEVQISGNSTAIMNYAFYDCPSLNSVLLSDSISSIGRSAFNGCDDLNLINIPEAVTSIGSNAFAGYTFLYFDEVTTMPLEKLPGHNFYGYGANVLISDIKLGDTLLHEGIYYEVDDDFFGGFTVKAISYSPGITDASIPKEFMMKGYSVRVDSVAPKAFYQCYTLESLFVNVNSIGDNAFYDCPNLKSADLTSKEIGSNAFYNCKSLEYLGIRAQHSTAIGTSAFSGCTGLNEISFGVLDTVGNNAFYGCTFYDTNGVDQLDYTDADSIESSYFSGSYNRLIRGYFS